MSSETKVSVPRDLADVLVTEGIAVRRDADMAAPSALEVAAHVATVVALAQAPAVFDSYRKVVSAWMNRLRNRGEDIGRVTSRRAGGAPHPVADGVLTDEDVTRIAQALRSLLEEPPRPEPEDPEPSPGGGSSLD